MLALKPTQGCFAMALTKPKPTALELDFRTRQGRRFAELCAELERRFAPKAPSLADLLRIKSAAALIVRLEQMQATAA